MKKKLNEQEMNDFFSSSTRLVTFWNNNESIAITLITMIDKILIAGIIYDSN